LFVIPATEIENPTPLIALAQLLDSANESAARLLFIAVKWARSMPSFHQVTNLIS
jgi:hypothetical protein